MSMIRFVRSPSDRKVALRLRRQIREHNITRFGRDVGGEEDPDLDGRTLCAFAKRGLIGTMDVHWGADAETAEEKFTTHRVDELLGDAPRAAAVMLDPAMVHPDHEDEPVAIELIEGAARFALRQRARFVFTRAAPTDVPIHQALGFRLVGHGAGGAVPMLLDLSEVTHLHRVRSPLAALAEQVSPQGFIGSGAQVDEAVAADEGEELDQRAVWRTIFKLRRDARDNGAAFLSHIEKSELSGLLLGSHVIEYKKGDKLIRKGEVGRELFLILDGEVAAMLDMKIVAFLGAGDVIGEIGFLLEAERTTNVVAFTPVKALRISAGRIDELMSEDPKLAAHLSLGIAKALCRKLMRTTAGR